MSNAGDVIREFAAQVDSYVEKYGKVPPDLRIEIRYTKADFAQICRHFDLVTQKVPDVARDDSYTGVRSTRSCHGVQIEGWNWISELCERKTVLVPKTRWVCGDEELERRFAA